jgi:type I restriction enzyme S subunit
MEVKLGYHQTEVGVIPEEWETSPCSKLSERIMVGIVIRPTQYYVRDGVPAFRSANIRENGITDSDLVFISEASNALLAKSQTRTGDVLTVRTGYPGTSAVVHRRHAGCNCIDILITRPSKRIDSDWLAIWINSPFGKEQVLRNQGGLAQKHFNVGDMRNLVVALPSKPEQRAIVEALSDVNGLLDGLERLIGKKRDLKQAVIHHLLTGQTRLPGFHGEWQVKQLYEVCFFRGGKAHEQHISEFGKYVCVNSKFISTDGEVRKYSNVNFCPAKRNDILMVMSDLPNGRALAKTFLVDHDDLYAVNQRVCALTPFRDCAKFLFYVLNRNPYFLKFDDGVSQTHLLNPVFKKFALRIPPTVAEQTAIAEILGDMDLELAALERQRDKTRDLRQAMMQELLTGRTRLVSPKEVYA